MGKSEEIRKKQTKIIKRILICTITILVIVAICLIATIVSSNKEKEDNLVKKLAIIDRLKELAESPEDANKAYNEFKKLQQEWNDIKQVPR